MRASRLLAAIAALAALTQPAATGDARPDSPPEHGAARPVPAWLGLCGRLPAECAVGQGEPDRVVLDPSTRRAIEEVDRAVNARIRPVADTAHWGVADRWDLAGDGRGDCEDYALLKRRTLALRGLPRRAMRVAAVVDERGDGHAVLLVRTDRGDVVLDNKAARVEPWRRTGYEFVKREADDGRGWVALRASSAVTPPPTSPRTARTGGTP